MNRENIAGARSDRIRHLTSAALLAALLAVSAWIVVPVGPVPVTLQTLVVVLVALTLPPAWSAAAVATYLAIGATGLPVFSGGQGGLGVIAGPTGGYLIGFLVATPVGAFLARRLPPKNPFMNDAAASAAVIAIIYVIGATRLATVLNLSAADAIGAGVAPFIAFDLFKAAAAVFVAGALRRGRSSVLVRS